MYYGEATPRFACDWTLVLGLLLSLAVPLAPMAIGVLEIAFYDREMAAEFVQNLRVQEFLVDFCRELKLMFV